MPSKTKKHARSSRRADRCVSDVEQPVNDHAGDGDIEPERKRPARNLHVAAKFLTQPIAQRNHRERHNCDGENRMRNEQREVHRPDPSLAPKADKPGVKMKIEVAAEKNDRARERAQHANLMLQDPAAANEYVTNKQENCRRPIQTGVESRKLSERNQSHEADEAADPRYFFSGTEDGSAGALAVGFAGADVAAGAGAA